jgi:hypothetical protein
MLDVRPRKAFFSCRVEVTPEDYLTTTAEEHGTGIT